MDNVVGRLRWLMRSFFSDGCVLAKMLLIHLHIALSNDLLPVNDGR